MACLSPKKPTQSFKSSIDMNITFGGLERLVRCFCSQETKKEKHTKQNQILLNIII
jgi:hypothetical protein